VANTAHHEEVDVKPPVIMVANPQGAQRSFTGPEGLKDFGQRLKAINDGLGELQARGIEHYAALPELVLVGDQSSGKSSLMSAIAGLALPRSSGTCTRCPIHIRVSRADEWSCRVYLKRDYKYVQRRNPITRRDVTNRDPFPPWVRLEYSERLEFKTVRDRLDSQEIETAIRFAQIAILNPSQNFQTFIPKSEGEVSDQVRMEQRIRIMQHELQAEAQFSPNTVALEVRGPDLADLSFYDLPGVFMSAKREEDTFLERVVRNLACEYIARPNAIILWAVPMNQDADNSFALSLIREKAAADRCVGVLTKADLLPPESAASWLSMLRREAHQTGLGYFITSRQGDDLDKQNAMEEAFFNRTGAATADWPRTFEPFRERCGIPKLKSFLSQQLGEQFAQVLPQVMEKIRYKIGELEEQLQFYPDPPANPEMEIMRSLEEFSRGVKELLNAQPFQSEWDQKIMDDFKEKILAAKPRFLVSVDRPVVPSLSRPAAGPEIIHIDDNSPPPSTPNNRKRQISTGQGGTPKRQRPTPVKPETPARVEMLPVAMPSGKSKALSLMDVRQLIRQHARPGTHNLVSPEVYLPIYTRAAAKWANVLDAFISRTFDFLKAEMMKILDASFQHLTHTVVYKDSKRYMEMFLDSSRNELRVQLKQLYDHESKTFFTKDGQSLERNKAHEKRILSRHRHIYRWAAHIGDSPPKEIRKMESMTEEDLIKESERMHKEAAKMQPDPFETEIEVASYVRGYYLTAANRFIDTVALHVMSGLFPRVAKVIDEYLRRNLGLSKSPTGEFHNQSSPLLAANRVPDINLLTHLMSEGPKTEEKRHGLKTEISNLNAAMRIISELRASPQPETASSTQIAGDSPAMDVSERAPSSVPPPPSTNGDLTCV